jgi:hypothetical protein
MYGKFFVVVAAALAIAGCSTSPPTVDTSAEAEMTFDGLYPVKNSRADKAWARADVDLTQYSKIMLESVGAEYRPGGASGTTLKSRSSGGPYEISEANKARFESIMREEFLKELGKSKHFAIVSEPGPDVLLVRVALLDVVSYVPPEPIAARSEVFLSSVGEATLVLELRDSITDAILARAMDRRAAEKGGGSLSYSNPVTNAAEVRRLVRTWGRLLTERLDQYGGTTE